tara:strand:+ start:751 stop:1455 length:705 start_codon:yes stop_codon:yes gene_type:complete
MKIKGPLINATFISRPNRFIVIVKIKSHLFKSHLADPGRLKELLVPKAKLLVRKVEGPTDRKTKYSTIMVIHKGHCISLVSTLPNRFVKESLEKHELPILKDYKIISPEFTVGNHRIDFLLNNLENQDFLLEVKSVTYSKNGLAKFPDAITSRGLKHIKLLTKVIESGKGAGVLFVCQRSDVTFFKPMWDRDPKFSKALLDGFNIGLKIWCISTNLSKTEMTFKKQIPFQLEKD